MTEKDIALIGKRRIGPGIKQYGGDKNKFSIFVRWIQSEMLSVLE